jgi:MarR family 2-MHQ and catechol resistance regulon transcriptional repressor
MSTGPDRGSTPDVRTDSDEPAARAWSEGEERALRLWIALARCYSTFSRAVACKVQEYGLTTPQFGILEALHHLGPLSLGELAEKLLVTGGNVTYVMDRLEDQGLVYRERSPQDRRIIQAKLTPQGKELITKVFPGHARYVERLASHLGDEELEEMRSLLKKLGRAVRDTELA